MSRTEIDTIYHAVTTLCAPGSVVELRCVEYEDRPSIGKRRFTGTLSGYFNDFHALAREAALASPKSKGTYITLNPVHPDLLARRANRTEFAKEQETTPDAKILRRHWLPLDEDPVRDVHISASAAEHEQALARSAACEHWLTTTFGFPSPLAADSGNGGHRLYRVDLPNDDDSRTLIERCLKAVALEFTDDVVKIDTSVFNAARIWKLYGTQARKGDSLPDRPHRTAQILSCPERIEVVSVEQLRALAALVPEPDELPTTPRGPRYASFDVEDFLARHGITGRKGAWAGKAEKWLLDSCPFNSSHTDKSAVVVRFDDGRLGFRCHHNSCQGRRWRDMRDLFEPARGTTYTAGAQSRQEGTPMARAHFIRATDVREEELSWLWPGYIARKLIALLDGDPGVGKTMFACQLAASITRGHPLPDQSGKLVGNNEPGNVLMVAMEDHLGAVVIPRLRRCGADLERITFVSEMTDADGTQRSLTLEDLPLLTEYMERVRPQLVYIDAIQAVLGGKTDINRANAVTALLIPLKKLAEHYDTAVLCSRHPAKPGQHVAKVLHRGMGSQAFAGTARCGLFVEVHPQDDTKSLLVHYKSNTGQVGRTQIFSKAGGQFEWCGASRVTHAILAGGGPGPSPEQRLKACLWLEARLKADPSADATTLYTEGEELDFSKKVLRGASEAIGMIKTQVPGNFLWRLPPLEPPHAHASPPPHAAPNNNNNNSVGTGSSGVEGSSGSSGSSGSHSDFAGVTVQRSAAPQCARVCPNDPDAPDTPDDPVVSSDPGGDSSDWDGLLVGASRFAQPAMRADTSPRGLRHGERCPRCRDGRLKMIHGNRIACPACRLGEDTP